MKVPRAQKRSGPLALETASACPTPIKLANKTPKIKAGFKNRSSLGSTNSSASLISKKYLVNSEELEFQKVQEAKIAKRKEQMKKRMYYERMKERD